MFRPGARLFQLRRPPLSQSFKECCPPPLSVGFFAAIAATPAWCRCRWDQYRWGRSRAILSNFNDVAAQIYLNHESVRRRRALSWSVGRKIVQHFARVDPVAGVTRRRPCMMLPGHRAPSQRAAAPSLVFADQSRILLVFSCSMASTSLSLVPSFPGRIVEPVFLLHGCFGQYGLGKSAQVRRRTPDCPRDVPAGPRSTTSLTASLHFKGVVRAASSSVRERIRMCVAVWRGTLAALRSRRPASRRFGISAPSRNP